MLVTTLGRRLWRGAVVRRRCFWRTNGVFAFGKDVRSALKAAVMLEDVSKTCHLALLLGTPQAIPSDEVEKWHGRYHSTYGQPAK